MKSEKFRWPDDKENIIEFYQTFDNSICIDNIEEMFLWPLNKDYLLAAENITKKGLYSIPPYGVMNFGNSIDWGDDSTEKRSFMRLLHGHFLISDLIEAFKNTTNSEYLYKGYEMIQDWIEKNPFENSASAMAWHDETTARRLINWIAFFDESRRILAKDNIACLFENIKKHAELLNTDNFYSKNTNHGMFQDEALIVYSDYFFCIEGSQGLKQIACSRLKQYFDFIFSNEGVHLEHSPGYHELIAYNLLKYSNYFKNLDRSFGEYLLKKYNQAAKFATYIIKPDGFLPQIGDTQMMKPSSKLWIDDIGYKYAVTMGKEGAPPKETDIVFPESGYAIFRDSWTKNECNTYVLFMAAYHTDYHKHSDDLSLWIYASGGDIILESGPYGYNYKDQFTQYSYSSFAHNVLIVDNKGLPRTDGKYYATKIVDYMITEHKCSVTGVNERYKDVKHTRTIEYLKANQDIIVTDEISSNVLHEYKLLWHLAPDIEAFIKGKDKVVLYRKDISVMEIVVKCSTEISLSKVRGQMDPFVLGWYYKKFEQKEPIDTLIFGCTGKGVTITTNFIISNQQLITQDKNL